MLSAVHKQLPRRTCQLLHLIIVLDRMPYSDADGTISTDKTLCLCKNWMLNRLCFRRISRYHLP